MPATHAERSEGGARAGVVRQELNALLPSQLGTHDDQGQILALASRQKSSKPLKLFPFCSEAARIRSWTTVGPEHPGRNMVLAALAPTVQHRRPTLCNRGVFGRRVGGDAECRKGRARARVVREELDAPRGRRLLHVVSLRNNSNCFTSVSEIRRIRVTRGLMGTWAQARTASTGHGRKPEQVNPSCVRNWMHRADDAFCTSSPCVAK